MICAGSGETSPLEKISGALRMASRFFWFWIGRVRTITRMTGMKKGVYALIVFDISVNAQTLPLLCIGRVE